MKPLLLVLFLALLSGLQSSAEEVYHIKKVAKIKSSLLIHIGRDWRKDIPNRVEVTLRVKEKISGKQPYVRAYFYDRDNVLLKKFDAAPALWMNTAKGFSEVTLPGDLETSETYMVQFPIAEEFHNADYKTILIVFGDSTQAVAESYPNADYSALTFDEKSLLAPASQ